MTLDRERILQTAQKYVAKKRYDRAIEEYQRIVREDPGDARTLLKIGDLQARMQAFGDAVATYDRVGQHYAQHGFSVKAIAVYKQIRDLIRKHAPELADKYAHVTPRLAEIYMQLGLTSDALAAYDEMATRLQRNGRERDAIKVFARMVELDANNPLFHLRFAEACARLQRLDEAIGAFWQAAQILLQMQRNDDALRVIERILHFRQDVQYARVAAGLYLQKGDRESGLLALAKLQICFQADPKDLNTLGLLAHAFTQIEQPDKAIEVHKEMARIARDQGQHELFSQLTDHLADVAPEDGQVRALLALREAESPNKVREEDVVNLDDEIEFVEEEDRLPVPESSRRPVAPARAKSEPVPLQMPDEAELPEASLALDAGTDASEISEAEIDEATISEAEIDEATIGEAEIDEATISEAEISEAEISEAEISEAEISEAEISEAEIDEAAIELVEDRRVDFDVEAHSRKAIADAESFRRLRLYSKAVDMLRGVLEFDPRSIELRNKLRQILAEAGEEGAANTETLTLAALFLEDGDTERAEPLLNEVLAKEPDDAVALELLGQLSTLAASPYGEPQLEESAEPGRSGEWVSVSPSEPWDSESSAVDVVDEPFEAEDGQYLQADMPLPSFPLSSEEDRPSGTSVRPPSAAEPRATTRAGEPGHVEAILEEAEFFASRGLLQDARMILLEQLARTPQHPIVLDRLQEVDDAMREAGIAIEEPDLRWPETKRVSPEYARGEFDVASSLDALDDLGLSTETLQAEAGQYVTADQEVDVDQVFERFKEGVRAQVDDSDSATHYDLGVAYKEMGLWPDAIREFELAANDPGRECMCFAMIGLIHTELAEYEAAAKAYVRGLSATRKSPEQELGLSYDLGCVYEQQDNYEDALHYFRKVAKQEPGYRDVEDRIAALEPRQDLHARAVNDDEEFDRVFDELFNTK